MRQLKLPLLFALAMVSVFMACKKDIETILTDSSDVLHTKAGTNGCFKAVRVECGMLSFPDIAAYQATYNCLNTAFDAHLDGFASQYGSLNEDDYNDMADNLGFVDEQPLIDFENNLGFRSYRSTYASELDLF